MQIVNGCRPDGRGHSVQPADRLLDLPAERLVGRDLVARGNGDLNVPDGVAQVRTGLEEPLQRLEPPRDALRVVETIDPEDDTPASGIAADGLRLLLDGRLSCELVE